MTTEEIMYILSKIKRKCIDSECYKCPFNIEHKISGGVERDCQFALLGNEFSEFPADWNLLNIEEILNDTNW